MDDIYYHFCPTLLSPGSIIEPGNFGRIIRDVGDRHPLYQRETLYEEIRQRDFPGKPSRLKSIFLYRTELEAALGSFLISRQSGQPETAVLYKVTLSNNLDVHRFCLSLGYGKDGFNTESAVRYWRGIKHLKTYIEPLDIAVEFPDEYLSEQCIRVVSKVNLAALREELAQNFLQEQLRSGKGICHIKDLCLDRQRSQVPSNAD